MRLLLVDHDSSPDAATGSRGLAAALTQAGHWVRQLCVSSELPAVSDTNTVHVVCSTSIAQADLPFVKPAFAPAAGESTFRALTDAQLANYRTALRRRLDEEIDLFDPHCVHAQQTWLFGQLALESGVSYVLTLRGLEWTAADSDQRCSLFAEQAAENAGRVLVSSDNGREEILRRFANVEGQRIQIVPGISTAPTAKLAATLSAIYESVCRERFGTLPP